MSVPQVDHMTIPTNLEWRKATFSGVQNDCVELTFFGGENDGGVEGDALTYVGIRDSKAVASGGVPLVLPRGNLGALLRGASQLA